LIKSVTQPIPSYLMSTFLLPNYLIKQIEKMLNAFWWGHGNSSRRGMHWMTWEWLTVPKSYGGMGFKGMKFFNKVILRKQAWKFLTHPDSLITRLFKARYFSNTDYLATSPSHNPSFVWRSLYNVKDVIRSGFKWSIWGDANIYVWDQSWICNNHVILRPVNMNPVMAAMKVSNLLHPNLKEWHTENIYILFDNNSANHICITPLFVSVQHDRPVWKFEKQGTYSSRSVYRKIIDMNQIVEQHGMNENWKQIWRCKAPPRIKNFLWRVTQDASHRMSDCKPRG
jgi:hypothetical protein